MADRRSASEKIYLQSVQKQLINLKKYPSEKNNKHSFISNFN